MTLVATGSCLPFLETCVGEDYFAITTRRVLVGLADTIVYTAVTPIFERINPDIVPES